MAAVSQPFPQSGTEGLPSPCWLKVSEALLIRFRDPSWGSSLLFLLRHGRQQRFRFHSASVANHTASRRAFFYCTGGVYGNEGFFTFIYFFTTFMDRFIE